MDPMFQAEYGTVVEVWPMLGQNQHMLVSLSLSWWHLSVSRRGCRRQVSSSSGCVSLGVRGEVDEGNSQASDCKR